MTEMDFDELDKAVNSLMGGVKQSQRDKDEPTTLTISSTLAVDEKPSYDKLEKVAKKIGNETIDFTVAEGANETVVEVPTATPQKAGRFMDVMHPSSDMRPVSAVSKTDAEPIAEPIVTPELTPVAEEVIAVEAPAPTERALVDAPSVVEQTPIATEEVAVPVEKKSEIDPIPEVVEEVISEPQSDSDVAVQAIPDEAPVIADSVDDIEPQTSPFLPDAKVEKRPLGGVAIAGTEGNLGLLSEPTLSAIETPIVPATAAEKIPDEYHDQLVAIEAGAATDTPAVTSAQATDATTVASAADTTAIYDVDNYHQPINHPAKKSSGWLWVILIIVIVAICGGIAAAFYLLTS
ncbi:MAG: hypothetical protein EOO17_01085 [Chloroflexi bacterium]|nr:MAG: hypothetical protein EOO17_01085 [Chloroflexota bacterium]